MRKVEILKAMSVILLSTVIVMALSNLNTVFAADEDDIWGSGSSASNNESSNEAWDTPSVENNTTTNTANDISNNTSSTNNTSLELVSNNTTNSTTNNTVNNTNNTAKVNSTTANTNSLAKTGIADSKGIVTLIVVICGITAVYSLKKVRDYKDM